MTIAAPPNNNQLAGETWSKFAVNLDTTSPWHLYGFDAGISDGGFFDAGASEDQIRQVLSNVVSFKIRGEWSTAPEQSCVDNIYVGIQ